MARKKSSFPHIGIARPIMKGELDRKRIHLKELSREELEDLLIRAADNIQKLSQGYQDAYNLLKKRSENMGRGSAARLAKDEKQKTKEKCEAAFLERVSAGPAKRGDRAKFIRDMASQYAEIEDPRTFGEWWDEWTKKLPKSDSPRSPLDPEILAYLLARDRAFESMPEILRTLGYIPKGLPRWPKDID